MTDFAGLELAQPILRAVSDEGYTSASPIQAKSIPPLMAGRDLLGIAQTGTGKTAAFALPMLHRLLESKRERQRCKTRALILAPTRELACQIADSLRRYGRLLPLRTAVVFGGAPKRPQVRTLTQGVDVLVATPGRLLDMMKLGHLQLHAVEFFVLDEADRMLDMGFIPDVKKITAALPKRRQTALFSATMPKSIQGLADALLRDPVRIEAAPAATTAEKVTQQVYFVHKEKKQSLIVELLNNEAIKRVLIFTRTKRGADRLATYLERNRIKTEAIHGDKDQRDRQTALNCFKSGQVRALVATDVAARGIDVSGVTHVINFDLPTDSESYVHRIGRTARAGKAGVAISFCDRDEHKYLRTIERATKQNMSVIVDHPFHAADIASGPGGSARRPAASKKRPVRHYRGAKKPGGRAKKGRAA